MESAGCVIVVWSGNSISKDWVCDEAEEGRKKNILVPVSIEEVKIPLSFRSVQAANLIDWKGHTSNENFKLLMESITAILEAPPAEEIKKSRFEVILKEYTSVIVLSVLSRPTRSHVIPRITLLLGHR